MKNNPVVKYIIVSSIVTLAVVTFLTKGNLIALVRAKHTIRMQEKQIERYNAEIRSLDAQIDAMSTDRDTLESFARERYHFAAEGDDVYIVE